MVSSLLWAFTLNASAEQGSADAFGYRWTDSDSPDPTVGFNWIEISGTGTNTGLYGDDDWDGPFPIGFTFSFYGNAYSDFYTTTNGYMTFGSGDYDYSNDPIPSTSTPNNFVAAYWDDLYVEPSGGVYYDTLGSAPNRQLVVEWLDTRQLGGMELMSFEIILNETGEAWTQYNWLNGDQGWYCTVGLENSDGSIGCQYSYNTAVLHDALAVMYSIAPVAIGPDDQQMGVPGADVYYWLDVRNNQGITDSFDVTYSSLEGWAVGLYDWMLNPLVDNNGNGIPDTGDVAPASSVSICAVVTIPDPPLVQFEQTTIVATSFADSALWDDALLVTQAAGAALAPPHVDWGEDTDADGLYDYLVVDVNLDVSFSDDYYLNAVLNDPSWVWLDSSFAWGYFDPGSGMLQVRFDGYTIRSNGVDGLFNVWLYLYDSSWNNLDANLHVTAFYAAAEFEPPPIEFAPPHTDYGLDTGGDGLYNYLVVEVSVFVNSPGDFMITSNLLDSMGGWIASDDNQTYLDAGANVIELRYPGLLIRNHGVDGPYIVDMALYFWDDSAGWWTWLDWDQHTTAAYLWSDFNGPTAAFAPPHTDYGIDQTGDGEYEYLVVEVSLDVAEAGTFELMSWLYDPFWSYVTSAGNLTYLDAGLQTVELWFAGWEIYMNGVNGNFQAYIELYDADGYYIASDWHTTAYYDYVDFQALAKFTPPHADHGLDIDGDGLFNYLVIEVEVYVLMDDYYYFYLGLYDMFGWFIWGDDNYTYLEVGMHTITWLVPGWYILSNGVDGPYDAYFDVYWDYGPWLDSGMHTTAPYLYTDFNGPPATFAPPHNDFGYDEDGDLLFDYLVVEVVVDVDIAGEYRVDGTLYDSFWTWLGWDSNDTYLDTGFQVVQLWFLAWNINMNGVDGPYYVDLVMFDSDGNFLDSDFHTTQAYAWSDFEPYPAVFSPPHSEYGLDLDGDGLYDYLVVEVYVDVASAGMFVINGVLWSPSGWYITQTSSEIYLDVGIQVVELWFPGYLIRSMGESGNFEVGLDLYTGDYIWLDWNTHWTMWYGWDEFGFPPIVFDPPHSDYGLDTDSDGLYEYLVVQASVDVSVAGTYWIMAVVDLGTGVGFASNLTYLDTGLQIVDIKVPGWQMVAHAVNGPYDVALWAYDETITNMMDSDMYLTGVYTYDEFDGAVPTIVSGWTATPPTIDGVVSAGEWAAAEVVDMSAVDPLNMVDATMLVMNNGTHLFVAYDATGDITEDLDDMSSIGFDTGNDEVFTDGGDDQFMLSEGVMGGSMHFAYDEALGGYDVDCQPFDDTLPGHAGLAGAVGFGPSDLSVLDHRMYEYAIPLALIDAAAGDVLGFMGGSFFWPGVYDSDIDWWANWPVPVPFWATLQDFGDLVLANLPVTTVTLDGTAGLNGWFISDVTVTLTATGGQGGVDYTRYRVDGGAWTTYAAPFVITGDGVHTLEFYSVDMGGNSEPVQSVDVMIDLNAPVTSPVLAGTGSGEWWSTDVEVTLTADDGAGSGADVTYYSIDGGLWQSYSAPFTVTGEGNHTVEFYSIDIAGNEETAVLIDIRIETTPPTTTHTLAGTIGLDDWYTTPVTVTLTASDTPGGSGVAETMYRIDTGAWQTYTAPFIVSTQGTYNVSYYSIDNAGNIEATKYVEFKVDATDPTTSHTVAGTAGQNGWYTSAATVTLAASDGTGGSGLDEVKYRIGGGAWQTYTAAISVSTDGTTTIDYYAIDNAGNTEATKSVAVKVDRVAPASSASVEDGTVTLTATDATSGVAKIEYRIDGGSWQDYTEAFEVTDEGNHTVEYRAVDNAGNVEATQTTYVEIEEGGGILGGAALWGIIAAVVIVAAIVIVLLLMKRRKGPGAPEELPPPPAEPPPEGPM